MRRLTATHTYAELEISPAAYDEIAAKLRDAEYDHAFMDDGTIDMHGIGLTKKQEAALANTPPSTRPITYAERKCLCPYPPADTCWCSEHMGTDFWFLPADACIYEKPNRWRDGWRKFVAQVKRFWKDDSSVTGLKQ